MQYKSNLFGTLSVLHYAFRFIQWYVHGHISFDGSMFTLACIAVHMAAIIADIGKLKVTCMTPMWPRIEMYNIVFALRSISVMLLHWCALRYPDYRGILLLRGYSVVVSMIVVDEITKRGSSSRGIMFPATPYFPKWLQTVAKMFYSVSQVYASLDVLMRPRMSGPFMVLFPFQIASILTKYVLSSTTLWHLCTTATMVTPYIYNMTNNADIFDSFDRLIYHTCAWWYIIARFGLDQNKYFLWAFIIAINNSKPALRSNLLSFL